MRHILSTDNREVLEQLAGTRVLLGFDFDGTLAPLVRDPELAVVPARTRFLLEQVARKYPCVVISGRAQADVRSRVRGIELAEVIGNHGMEPSPRSDRFRQQVARWEDPLARDLASVQGVNIENKGLSIAIHFRDSRQRKKAREAIVRATSALEDVRVVGGKLVVNVLPLGAPNKGTALTRVQAAHGCDTAMFVGDDDTDEDVFALDRPGQLITIRVGASRRSAATYFLRNQGEIDGLLRELSRARQARLTTRIQL